MFDHEEQQWIDELATRRAEKAAAETPEARRAALNAAEQKAEAALKELEKALADFKALDADGELDADDEGEPEPELQPVPEPFYPEEPEVNGSVVTFTVRLSSNPGGPWYNYAAIKAGQHWFLTGRTHRPVRTWKELVDWMRKQSGCSDIYVMQVKEALTPYGTN